MPEKLNTTNCVKLLQKDIPSIQFIVDKLLAPGFYILAGLPKIGKSWLLLMLCIKVAMGLPLWNYPTRQGRVLYLCLEDQEARIQERVEELTADGAPMLEFATKALTLSTGLLFQLESFIQDYPDTKLIVIDTLPKVRDSDGEGNIYATDYRDIGALKALADKYGVAIIAVQHLRKLYSPDPFQMVSGSSGLLGAADGCYVLKKEKHDDNTAKLYIQGRDVAQRTLTIRFDHISKEWLLIADDTPEMDIVKSDPSLSAVVSLLHKEQTFRGTASELCQRIHSKLKPNALTRRLNRYAGELQQLGVYMEADRTSTRRELVLTFSPSGVNDDMTVMTHS